ncbi:copper chaperone PCu(A)C [Xylophilus rhododendri]|uniref:Copper chaperone PCu(A)C n=1 Tax=Xylophilus rhododendri TaxID=2697032 RepID=A0A857JAG2_9BURK|nr:copper chaperone PCu(A)C [Xylophilus rhododendri]QHI99728.1 copper chaperone PCu(A)C [Xylophilus rhododendri]
MTSRRLFCTLALLGAAASIAPVADAHEYYLPGMVFVHPWAEATAPGVKSAPVYFSLEDVTAANRIVKVVTPIADKVVFRAGGPVAKAGLQKTIDIQPGGETQFTEGKPHLLLQGLKEPLQWGRSYEMTLYFEKGGAMQVQVSVGAH